MKPLGILLAACLLAGVQAQESRPAVRPSETDDPPEPSPTTPEIHTIDVGANGNSIEPNVTKAKIGDIVEWKFHSGEHWIIRGTLEHPCIPREYFYPEREKLSSGPMKVEGDSDEKPVFRVRINGTSPMLFYSGADGACVDDLMMGIINPGPEMNLLNYKRRGEDAKFQLRPGDPWPEGEEPPSTTNSNIPSATETGTEETSGSPADNEDNEQSDDDGLSTGAIAGLSVGGVAALIIFGLAIFYCGRRGGVKILFTNETRKADPREQFPRYATPAATEAPFRPPRPPSTENWRPTMDRQGNVIPRTMSPQASIYRPSLSAGSPYKGHGASGYLSAGVSTPPARYEQRHIASYYDPHLGTPGVNRPSWNDMQSSRVASPAVELPASSDPGHSPLPQYQAGGQGQGEVRKFSWSGTGENALFRASRV